MFLQAAWHQNGRDNPKNQYVFYLKWPNSMRLQLYFLIKQTLLVASEKMEKTNPIESNSHINFRVKTELLVQMDGATAA